MKMPNKFILLSLCFISAGMVLSSCDSRKHTAGSATPNTTVGAAIDDSVITTKVKSALLADATVKGMDIKVETHQGVAQLSGFVDSQAQVDRAVQIARGVEGVKDVENKMTVKK